MNIRIKGTKYQPDPLLVEEITGKLQKLERLCAGKTARAEMELSRAVGGQQKGDVWRAELMVMLGAKKFRAESLKAKLDHAVTTVLRDVAGELRRAREKTQRVGRTTGARQKNLGTR